jgi:hypothetical protein
MKIVKQGKDISECLCTGVAEEFIWALQAKWIILICDICGYEIETPEEALILIPKEMKGEPYQHYHQKCLEKSLNSLKAKKEG